MWTWVWSLLKTFIAEGFRAFVGFITVILGWNIIFPFIFPSSFVSGAFDYLDLTEIFSLSITPFIIYLMTHFSTHRYLSKPNFKTFSYIFNLILNIAGIFSVMFGYGILSQNAPGAVYFKIIPESINFGHSAIVWIFLIFQGSFSPTFLRIDFPTPPKIDFKGFRRDRSSLAKTSALPKSGLNINPPAEVAVEPKPTVESAPEPVAQVAPEPKVEVTVEPKPAVETLVEAETPPKVEIKAEPVLPKKQELIPIGTKIENVEFEENTGLNRSGLRTKNRIGGKISFPDRRGPQPQAGDVWTVEISGTNPNDSVYFVKCIKRESSLNERLSQNNSSEVSNGQDPYQGIQL